MQVCLRVDLARTRADCRHPHQDRSLLGIDQTNLETDFLGTWCERETEKSLSLDGHSGGDNVDNYFHFLWKPRPNVSYAQYKDKRPVYKYCNMLYLVADGHLTGCHSLARLVLEVSLGNAL